MSEKKQNILVVDDEQGIRLSLQGILEDEGHHVSLAQNGSQALSILNDSSIDLIILDIWLDAKSDEKNYINDGLIFLQHIKALELFKDIPVIMISGHGTIETAVTALKFGAYDFIEKPLALDAVLSTVNRAFEFSSLKSENKALKSAIATRKASHTLIGDSAPMRALKSAIEAVAPTSVWVLITGENGTGKELVANAIYNASPRADKPFIAVNCAAIPEELIESELFGHERGAFTGAESRIGKFELADGGTLFLDEIGDMSLKTQAKVLRILQEQRFERIGGNKTLQVDVRVLAATNMNLEQAMHDGTFRSDLYYRLRGFPLHLPALRERVEDIPALVAALSQNMHIEKGLEPPTFSQDSYALMQTSSWRGNVRELKHILEQVAILYPKTIIHPDMIKPLLSGLGENTVVPCQQNVKAPTSFEENSVLNHFLECDYKNAKAEFELWYLSQKYAAVSNNMTKLAELVGLDRSYLHRKLKSKSKD